MDWRASFLTSSQRSECIAVSAVNTVKCWSMNTYLDTTDPAPQPGNNEAGQLQSRRFAELCQMARLRLAVASVKLDAKINPFWHQYHKKRLTSLSVFKSGNPLLETILWRNCQFLATVTAAWSKYPASIGRSHSLAEAVFVATLADWRLKCSFHIFWFLYYSR